jgi:hypothetical protein
MTSASKKTMARRTPETVAASWNAAEEFGASSVFPQQDATGCTSAKINDTPPVPYAQRLKPF